MMDELFGVTVVDGVEVGRGGDFWCNLANGLTLNYLEETV